MALRSERHLDLSVLLQAKNLPVVKVNAFWMDSYGRWVLQEDLVKSWQAVGALQKDLMREDVL